MLDRCHPGADLSLIHHLCHVQVALLDPTSKDPSLRLRAANLLGLLVRHASSINSRLADAGEPRFTAAAYSKFWLEQAGGLTQCLTSCPCSGVAQALSACIRQKEDSQLQRRAAAALGELLFYADSQRRDAAQQVQVHGHADTPDWDLSHDAVERLAGLLQPEEDEVAQVAAVILPMRCLESFALAAEATGCLPLLARRHTFLPAFLAALRCKDAGERVWPWRPLGPSAGHDRNDAQPCAGWFSVG